MKGEALPEYWCCAKPGADGRDLPADDGGDATLLIRKGNEFEELHSRGGSWSDPASTDNAEFKCIL